MMIVRPLFPLAAVLSLVIGGICPPMTAFGQDLLPGPKPKNSPKLLIDLGLGDGAPKQAQGKRVEVALTPAEGAAGDLKPGDEVVLSITVRVPEDSYTYSMTTPKGGKTRFEIGKITGLKPVGADFQAEREPESELDPIFEGIVEKYHEDITWRRRYQLEDADLSDVRIEGMVYAQICDANTCRNVEEPFETGLAGIKSSEAIVHNERPELAGKPGPAAITISVAPKNAKPGETVTVTFEIAVEEGWHTYSITQPKVIGASPTLIQIDEHKNLKPLGEGFTPSAEFEKKTVDLGVSKVEHEVHHGTISWSRDYEVLAEGFGIKGSLDYQTCNAARCFPKTIAFDLQSGAARSVGREAPPVETAVPSVARSADALPADSREARLDALLGKEVEGSASDPETSGSDVTTAKSQGLFWFIVAAVGAGFLALLTPCVYPMVPITISFFLKQAEKQHHRPLTLALVYCLGIMATFTGLGLLISGLFEVTDLNRLANNVWLNLFLTAVITFFGISMLGLFEIHVPSWLLTWSAGKEQKGGIVGTLFMAFTFTLVSFTCTFAFAGALLVMASKGEVFWPIVGMLAFSAAFAFPFFLLALFPRFLTKLPKSGGWMNIIKVAMGFVEVGAALKFLSVADASYFGEPTWLPYGAVMGAWFVLALLAGLYPLGLFRLPHDTPGKFTFGRLAFATPFLALAAMLGLGLFTPFTPSGWVWDNIAAFAPPRFETGSEAVESAGTETAEADFGPYLEHDNLRYALDFFQALDFARQTNQPLFIDFTGINCINCRKMELSVLPKPDNRERLAKFVRVQLFTDTIPKIDNPELRESLLNINRKLQKASEDVALPGYVILNPHDVAENGKLKRLSSYSGMEQNPGEFTKFLDDGLKKFEQSAGQTDVGTISEQNDSRA